MQRAESSRQIRIVEAHAALESAKLTAQAEVERAKGVAQGQPRLSGSLGGPEGYLRWRYIEMLENSGKEGRDVIYVPTEAARRGSGRDPSAARMALAPLAFAFSLIAVVRGMSLLAP